MGFFLEKAHRSSNIGNILWYFFNVYLLSTYILYCKLQQGTKENILPTIIIVTIIIIKIRQLLVGDIQPSFERDTW